jgi:hemin uptake protein HemP
MMGATTHSSEAPVARSTPAGIGTPAGTAGRNQPLDSGELLRGRRVVEITHNGELYRLQATRLGKLILTK